MPPKHLCRALPIVTSAIAVWTLSCAPSPADSKHSGHPAINYLSVPVLYLTDRNKEGASYGPLRKYEVNCKHDPYYGVVDVSVANVKHKALDDRLTKMGWTQSPGKGKFTVQEIADTDVNRICQRFLDSIKEATAAAGGNEIYLVAMGTDEPFDDAATDAATLAYFCEKPVILYSWPSAGKYVRYRLDESNIEYSQAHFDTFLERLKELNDRYPLSVTLVAHSMGNRLVMRAAPFISLAGGIFKEIDLVSPDVDDETFKHYVEEYRSPNPKSFKVRLFVSYRDKMLSLSQRLHGGYLRLGEGADSMRPLESSVSTRIADAFTLAKSARAATPPNSTAVPADASSTPASINAAAPLAPASSMVAAPGAEEKQRLESQSKRFQTVDFTAIDSGLFGHVCPFELISNMNATGTPGEGLSLVHEDAPDPARVEDLRKSIQTHGGAQLAPGTLDPCDKVVRIKQTK